MHNGKSSPPVYGAKGELKVVVAASLQLLCLRLFFNQGGIDEIDVHKPQMMQCMVYCPIAATERSKSIYKGLKHLQKPMLLEGYNPMYFFLWHHQWKNTYKTSMLQTWWDIKLNQKHQKMMLNLVDKKHKNAKQCPFIHYKVFWNEVAIQG